MSNPVDQRIVEMQFDNKEFEKSIKETQDSLEEFKKSLDLEGATKGFEEVEKAAKSFSLVHMGDQLGVITSGFSTLGSYALNTFLQIEHKAVELGEKLAKALTTDAMKAGFSEYETQIGAQQTILMGVMDSQFGGDRQRALDAVNNSLNELNHYADQTIYNFTQMTKSIGRFTAQGVDLQDATAGVKGIANLAAVTGATAEQADSAMYMLSQSLAQGKMSLYQWRSLENSGMANEGFRKALMRTADAMGVVGDKEKKAYEQMKNGELSFRESISSGWLTSDILLTTLKQYAGDFSEAELVAMGYSAKEIEEILKMGQDAQEAATKVKTFTQLIDVLKEALQSGWTQTWQIIFGDLDEAKEMWTGVSNYLGNIISNMAEKRNNALKIWKARGGKDDILSGIKDFVTAFEEIVKFAKEAFDSILPLSGTADESADVLIRISKAIKTVGFNLKTFVYRNGDTISGIFQIMAGAIQFAIKGIRALFKFLAPVGEAIFSVAGSVIKFVVGIVKLAAAAIRSRKSTGKFGNTLEVIRDIVIGLVKAFGNVLEKVLEWMETTGFFDKMVVVFQWLGGVIGSVINYFKNLVTTVKTYIRESGLMQKVTEKIGKVFGPVGDKIKTFAKNVWEHLKKFFVGENGELVNPFKTIGEKLETYKQSFLKWFNESDSPLASVLRKISEGAAKLWKSVKNFFTGEGDDENKDAQDISNNTGESFFAGVKGKLDRFIESITEWFDTTFVDSGIVASITKRASEIWGSIKKFFTGGDENTDDIQKDGDTSLIGRVRKKIQEIKDSLEEWFQTKSPFPGIVASIRTKASSLWKSIKNFFTGLSDKAGAILNSSDFEGEGTLVSRVISKVSDIYDDLKNWFDGSWFSDAVTWIKDKAKQVWRAIKDFFTGKSGKTTILWNSDLNGENTLISKVVEKVTDVWKRLKAWFEADDKFPAAAEWVKNKASTIWTAIKNFFGGSDGTNTILTENEVTGEKTLISKIIDRISDIWKRLSEWFNTENFFPKAAGWVSDKATSIWTAIKNFFAGKNDTESIMDESEVEGESTLISKIVTKIQDIWDKLKTWFKGNNFFSTAATWVSEKATTIWTAIKNFFSGKSDTEDLMTEDDMEGEGTLVTKTMKKITDVWGRLKIWFDGTKFSDAAGWVAGKASEIWGAIHDFFAPENEETGQEEGLGRKIGRTIWEKLQTFYDNLVKWFGESSVFKDVKSWVSGIASSIWGSITDLFTGGDKSKRNMSFTERIVSSDTFAYLRTKLNNFKEGLSKWFADPQQFDRTISDIGATTDNISGALTRFYTGGEGDAELVEASGTTLFQKLENFKTNLLNFFGLSNLNLSPGFLSDSIRTFLLVTLPDFLVELRTTWADKGLTIDFKSMMGTITGLIEAVALLEIGGGFSAAGTGVKKIGKGLNSLGSALSKFFGKNGDFTLVKETVTRKKDTVGTTILKIAASLFMLVVALNKLKEMNLTGAQMIELVAPLGVLISFLALYAQTSKGMSMGASLIFLSLGAGVLALVYAAHLCQELKTEDFTAVGIAVAGIIGAVLAYMELNKLLNTGANSITTGSAALILAFGLGVLTLAVAARVLAPLADESNRLERAATAVGLMVIALGLGDLLSQMGDSSSSSIGRIIGFAFAVGLLCLGARLLAPLANKEGKLKSAGRAIAQMILALELGDLLTTIGGEKGSAAGAIALAFAVGLLCFSAKMLAKDIDEPAMQAAISAVKFFLGGIAAALLTSAFMNGESAAGLMKVLGLLALVLGGISIIMIAVGALDDAFGGKVGTHMNTGFEMLGDMLGGLMESVGKLLTGAVEGASESLPTIGDNISQFVSSISSCIEDLKKFDSDTVTGAGYFAQVCGELMKAEFKGWITSFFGKSALQQYAEDLTALTTALSGYSDLTQTKMLPSADDILTPIDSLYTFANELKEDDPKIQRLIELFGGKSNLRKLADDVGEFGTGFQLFSSGVNSADKVNTKMVSVKNAIKALNDLLDPDKGNVDYILSRNGAWAVERLASALSSTYIQDIVRALGDGQETIASTGKDVTNNAATTIGEGVENEGSNWWNLGNNLIIGINNGMVNAQPKVNETATAIAEGIRDIFAGIMKIHSPSRVFEDFGMYIDLGLVSGISKYAKDVYRTVEDTADGTVRTATKMLASVSRTLSEGIDATPVIRPVLDLSEVQSGAATIPGMFNSNPLFGNGLFGDSLFRRNAAMLAYEGGRLNGTNQNRDVVTSIGELSEKFNTLSNAVTNMQMVLDSGELVGRLGSKIDRNLGVLAGRRERGN